MVAVVTTSSNTILSVSASLPATHDSTGFAALTYTAVSDVVDMGDFGPIYNEVKHIPISDGIVQKFKGSLDYGKMSMKLGRDADDAGQAILKGATGLGSQLAIAFKVTFQDTSIQYFTARVMSYTTGVGSTDQIVGATVDVAITSAIVEVIAP